MKKIIAITLLLASVAAFPAAAPALADSSSDRLCGPDAPEGYKRPGGYCDQIDSKGSLVEQKDGCDYYVQPALAALKRGVTVLVAENCYPAQSIL